MSSEKRKVSVQHYNTILQRIADLNVAREAATQQMQIARGEGDLRENAEYSTAVDEIDKIDIQLRELNRTLESVEPSEDVTSDLAVTDNCRVKIHDSSNDKTTTLHFMSIITGVTDVETLLNTVTADSVLGMNLAGKHVGDTFSYADNNYHVHNVRVLEIY